VGRKLAFSKLFLQNKLLSVLLYLVKRRFNDSAQNGDLGVECEN